MKYMNETDIRRTHDKPESANGLGRDSGLSWIENPNQNQPGEPVVVTCKRKGLRFQV